MLEYKDEVKECLEDIKTAVHDVIQDLWRRHCSNYDFDVAEDRVPYGDTYVSSRQYVTDSSNEDCRQEFIDEYCDIDSIMAELRTDYDFTESLKDLVKAWANEKDLEV